MILAIKIMKHDLAYASDIKECLVQNSSNPEIEKIVVFSDFDLGIDIDSKSKKILLLKIDLGHFKCIERSCKISRDFVIYSTPFVKFDSNLGSIRKNLNSGKVLRSPDSYYIFRKDTKLCDRSSIDEILGGIFEAPRFYFQKNGYFEIPNFPVPSLGWKISRVSLDQKVPEAVPDIVSVPERREFSLPIQSSTKPVGHNIDVLIVSVDYNDFLEITLGHNQKIFDRITVVTSHSDKRCVEICEKMGVDVVITDIMYSDGAEFNKGKAINKGLDSLEDPEFVLILDADIIVPDMYMDFPLEEKTIYYRDRIMLRDHESYERFMKGSSDFETESLGPIGYFQLFKYDKRARYSESSSNAAWSDVKFIRKFRWQKKIDSPVIHLGEDRKNWSGRTTPEFNIHEDTVDVSFQGKSKLDEDSREFEINSYFDNIYCINLDDRKDRWKKAAKHMEIAGIYAERVSAVDGSALDFIPRIESEEASSRVGRIENAGALGCLLTHLKVVKDAKAKGYKKILILEDDVLFSNDFAKEAKCIAKKDWKMLYLGASQFDWSGISPKNGFYKCKNTLGTFAYALDCSIYDHVIKEFEKMDRSADNALAFVQNRNQECYVVFPNIAISDVSDSDIRKEKDMLEYSNRMNWDLSKFDKCVDIFENLIKEGHIEVCAVSDYQTNGKNILFLINLNDTGGAEYVSYQHVKALRELGYGVSVISVGKGMFFEKTLELGVTVYHSRLDKMDHSIINDILSEITKNVDVVYNCNYFGISDHIYGIKNKSMFEYFTIAHSNIEWVVDEVYRHDSITDRYIVIHDKIRDCLNMKGVCNSRICTIPNYVDFYHISDLYSKSDRDSMRKKMGFSKKDFVIGMTTRISPDKNILDSLRILQNLDKRAKLLIIGDAPNKIEAIPYKEEFLKEIEERNLSERVFITGHVDNDGVFEYLSCVDISMNTSPSEGLPISMLEQMSCGIHCVYPPHGEIAAVLEGFGSIIGIRQRKSFDSKSKDYLFNRFKDFEIDMYVEEIERIMDEGTIDRNLISDRIRYDRSVEAVRPYLDFAFGGPKEGVSFVIRARDEISNIESCIQSIADIADEIVYVDHLSKDGTYEKAIELSRIYSNLRVFRYDREIPKAGTNYRKNMEKIGNSIAQYYNFCLTKATRTCVLKWDADFVANKKNLSEMISVENLKNRRDKFSLWFTGETVFVCGEKKYINERSYYDEFRGFSLLNGVKWTDADKCEYIDRDYANSSISARFEKPCFYEIKRLDINEFEHRDGLIDIRDKNDFDIIASLSKGSVPEVLREIEFLNESVVITYGTFDTFHYGHLEILRKAKELGQFLIVGISTDRFNAIKGKKSVFSFEQRKRWIESIKHVDLVIEEDEWDQKYFDVRKYNADIFVMGDDWKGKFDDLPCKVVYLARTEGISTTEIKKIL